MKQSFDAFGQSADLPEIRRVGRDRPVRWLAAGWNDLRANPVPSLAYGLLFSIAGDLILLASLQQPHIFMVAVSGFFLVAPLLGAGLYELSRQLEAGRKPTFVDSVAGLAPSLRPIALFAGLLALIVFVWERISALAFAFVGDAVIGSGMLQVMADGQHRSFVAAWIVMGAALALLTFALSVVSVPLLLDRRIGVAAALMTSLRCFALNLDVLVLWAAILVSLTFAGFATFLAGLVFIMPLLGHSTWHAYRDLVK